MERFLCGLHGSHLEEARQVLAGYPVEIMACFGAVDFVEVSRPHWKDHLNDFRRQHVQPDEWCLYADADELHEYPPGFFTNLDPKINVVQGEWVERLATKDGRIRPCRPTGNIGHQYPYGTREIFCGGRNKIMATRGDLEVALGYHHIIGGADTPVYHDQSLNVHHFRWDDRAQAKYQDRPWTRDYNLSSGRVPVGAVFYVDPPFPAQGSPSCYPRSMPKISVVLPALPTAPPVGEVIASIQTQTFADWELIIVANGMAASSQAAIERYAQQDDRIRMEVRDNLNLAQARQAGFELAQGKYVYCLDASYLSLPDTLQRIHEALETPPAAVVAYGAVVGMNRSTDQMDILAQLVEDHFLRHGAVAVRRAALAEVLALTNSDLDDQALWWLLAANGPVTFVAGNPLSTPNTAPPIR